jgi:hypothetical protein
MQKRRQQGFSGRTRSVKSQQKFARLSSSG